MPAPAVAVNFVPASKSAVEVHVTDEAAAAGEGITITLRRRPMVTTSRMTLSIRND